MNRTNLVLVSLVGIVLVVSAIHWYKYKFNSSDPSSPPEYVKRLIVWAKNYHSVQPDDIVHIQESDTIKKLFISLKKVPTCRSAKLLAHLYFSIYVERDGKALREFLNLMKEHYPDVYQWDNAFNWKHAEKIRRDMYDTLSSKESSKESSKDSSKDNTKIDTKIDTKIEDNTISKTNKRIKNFKAVVSKTK